MLVLKYGVLALALLLAAAVAYVRFAPLDVAGLHVDPETAERPRPRGQFLVRVGGDLEPRVFEGPTNALTRQLQRVIAATPRTELLAGDLATGHASYVTRSGLWGFPDVASIKVVDIGDGTSSALILSRQVYGIEDLGVNKARVLGWLDQL